MNAKAPSELKTRTPLTNIRVVCIRVQWSGCKNRSVPSGTSLVSNVNNNNNNNNHHHHHHNNNSYLALYPANTQELAELYHQQQNHDNHREENLYILVCTVTTYPPFGVWVSYLNRYYYTHVCRLFSQSLFVFFSVFVFVCFSSPKYILSCGGIYSESCIHPLQYFLFSRLSHSFASLQFHKALLPCSVHTL